jgi:hypothetical protein
MGSEPVCVCGDAHTAPPNNKGSPIRASKATTDFITSYKQQYLAPPNNLYTGVSANLGLKARVEGTAASNSLDGLGLGDQGKSFYQLSHVHLGDAYKERIRPGSAAKKSRLKVDKWKPDYTTSYSVWGA